MPSINIDQSNKLKEYQSIFKHYGLERSMQSYSDDEFTKRVNNYLYDKNEVLERNASNKKTTNAKTISKPLRTPSSARSNRSKSAPKQVCLLICPNSSLIGFPQCR